MVDQEYVERLGNRRGLVTISEAGLDRAIVMALASVPVGSYDATMGDYIADLCRTYPTRLIGFYGVEHDHPSS